MSMEQGESEYAKSYPRTIQMKDGSTREVQSAEEEMQVRQEENENM